MIRNPIVIKAIDYILGHLDEDLRIDAICNHCNLSKFYFSRVFKAETGESVYGFVKRLKVSQSAIRLKTDRDRRITDIGYDYGYSPSNYATLFKQQLNQSPAAFRRDIPTETVAHPFIKDHTRDFPSFEEYNNGIHIVNLDDFLVICERYIGNYIDLSPNWCSFTERYKDFISEDSLLIERSYDDPSITPVDTCLYDLCVTVNASPALVALPEGTVRLLKGGKFAVYRFVGYVNDIFAAFQGLFNVWLPNSPYQMDDRYGLDIYREVDGDAGFVVMDLCIPIR